MGWPGIDMATKIIKRHKVCAKRIQQHQNQPKQKEDTVDLGSKLKSFQLFNLGGGIEFWQIEFKEKK